MTSLMKQSSDGIVQRFDAIQSARFWAALSVMIGHLLIFSSQKYSISSDVVSFASWFGGPAVLLFFAISGFVVSHSVQKISSVKFVLARLSRIYLGYWLAVFLVVLAKWAIWGDFPINEISLFALSLWPAGEIGYPLWIEWSLVFEVAFYILVGLLWIPRRNSVLILGLIIWFIAVFIVNLNSNGPGFSRYGSHPLFLLSLNCLPFIFGALGYQVYRLGGRVGWTCAVAITGPAITWSQLISEPTLSCVLLAVSAAVVVVACASCRSKSNDISWHASLGDASYGLYLMHTSVITILLALIPAARSPIWSVLAIGMTVLVLASTFGVIETKIHKRVRYEFARRE